MHPVVAAFPSLDDLLGQFRDLAQGHPGQVRLFSYGYSHRGEALLALSLGSGPSHVLAYAFPQPDEPLGGVALLYLARRLLREGELLDRSTWLLLPCVDPDGARLNERWSTVPLDLATYARQHFRPPEGEQVEWSFPSADPSWPWSCPLPETRALATLIEEARPDLLLPLHNSLLGGAYAFLSAGAAGLASCLPALWEACGVPTHLGEAELPFAEILAAGVYQLPGLREIDEALSSQGVADPAGLLQCGAPAYEYAARFGEPLVVVPELPLFVVAGIDDGRPSDFSRGELLGQALAGEQAAFAGWLALYEQAEPFLGPGNPYLRALQAHRRVAPVLLAATARWLETDPALGRPAGRAEVADGLRVAPYMDLLPLGLLVQALEAADEGPAPAGRDSLLAQAESCLEQGLAEALSALDAYSLPIASLIEVLVEMTVTAGRLCL